MQASSRSRILMLLENCAYPEDFRVAREAGALVKAGYEVSVICPAGKRQKWKEHVDGVDVYRFPSPQQGNSFLGYLWEYGYSTAAIFLLSMVAFVQKGFDVIHTHNPPDTLVFIVAVYKLLGKRFVYDHHDLAPEMYSALFEANSKSFVYRVLVWLEKRSCRLADHIVAVNQSYKQMEMERSGVPESRITIVRNGPDLSLLTPSPGDPDLRKKARTIIGFVGTMGFHDGVDYLLRAIRHLISDLGRTDFYCVLVGPGEAWASMKALSEQLSLQDYVWFTGHIPRKDLVRYLSTADICVDPDPSNSFNDRSTMIKMMEYMSFGKPIVAFDLPEHRFTAGEAALYVRPNNELEFARALVQLMDDPARRQTMGAAGRQRVEHELGWHRSVPNLLAAYESLGLNGRRKKNGLGVFGER